MCAMKVLLTSLLAVATVVAQEKPADASHDMEHMQHGGGMADSCRAAGITRWQRV
jgi:hypothetical protein